MSFLLLFFQYDSTFITIFLKICQCINKKNCIFQSINWIFFFFLTGHGSNTGKNRHTVQYIKGIINNILVVDGHKFYKSKSTKKTINWKCRLAKQLGWAVIIFKMLWLWGHHRFIDSQNNAIFFSFFIDRCTARCNSDLDGRSIQFLDLNHNHGVNTGTLNYKPKAPPTLIIKQEHWITLNKKHIPY